jgi:Ca2+-binding EF-hand superfamily protein
LTEEVVRQAKREALLEAATNFDQYEYGSVWAHRLRRMADELDTNAGL